MQTLKIYDYLVLARRRILDWGAGLSEEQYRREFPFGRGSVARTLTHIVSSEWYYVERMEERAVPEHALWPVREEVAPRLDALETWWAAQAARTRAAIAAVRDWDREIEYRMVGDDGRPAIVNASAGDIVTQLVLHEVHHRAQVMAMMRQMGVAAEDIDFNTLMYRRREAPAPSLEAETEALREAYAALNRGDVPGFVRVFDPQIERIEPADFPQGGTYRGLGAVTAHVAKGRGTWAEGRCEPERFIVAGDKVVVLVHVRVRLKTETEWREGRLADVYTFRDGKAVQFRTFGDQREALEWAGGRGQGIGDRGRGHMQDDAAALFAYDRWANGRVLDACRTLTAGQYAAEPVPGWSSVRSTVSHIALVTEAHLRTLAGDPDGDTPTEAGLVAAGGVDDAARLLERAYRRFDGLHPTFTPEWLSAMLTLRGSDPRIGDYAFTLPRWAMLRHIVNHSTYHRGQVASKLRRFGVEQQITDFFFWAVEQVPQGE